MNAIKIYQDENPTSPRHNLNLGVMACWHRKYSLGDENAIYELVEAIRSSKCYCDSWDNGSSEFYRDLTNPRVILETALDCDILAEYLPLYLYDHSGITMNTTGFSCRWDSGQVGFIYVTKEQARKEYNVKRISQKLKEQIKSILEKEVTEYDHYLTNEVYRFEIFKNNEIVDYGQGYFGSNIEENGMLDSIPKELHEQAKKVKIKYCL